MPRRRDRISLKPVLFIACEGTSSEYEYFQSWAKTDRALNIFQQVNVYPSKAESKPKTTPYELFQIAKRELDDGSANSAWIVFDKDTHPKLPQTFNDANVANVKIAFSSRSFEEWVLLHYEKNETIFEATECKMNEKPINCGSSSVPLCAPSNCLTGHIRRQNFITNYSKKQTFDLYAEIVSKTEIAIVNAAWLRYKMNASINRVQPNLTSLNPYTDVDKLIFILCDRSENIEWGSAGMNVTLNNWTIKVERGAHTFTVQLSHTSPQASVINEQFRMSSFYTTDDGLNDRNCAVNNPIFVSNHNGSRENILYQGDIVKYTLQINDQPYFLFKDNNSNTRIYIEL